jgi:H/ACA ribonucleoprotein complex subunit 4
VRDLPKVWVFDSAVESLCQGAKLHTPGISKLTSNVEKDKIIAVMSLKDELIGLGTALMGQSGMLEAEKGIAVKMDRIIMYSGTYPKMWKKKEETISEQ